MTMTTAKFSLGQCMATQGAMGALEDNQTFPIVYLKRHESGDWGDLDDHDRQLNDRALIDDSRILSAYKLADGQKIWIITEAVNDEDGSRFSTTILLPCEY